MTSPAEAKIIAQRLYEDHLERPNSVYRDGLPYSQNFEAIYALFNVEIGEIEPTIPTRKPRSGEW